MKIRNLQSISIIVQLGDFQCIDVFQKGYYQIKARVYGKYKTSSGTRRLDAIAEQAPSRDGSESVKRNDTDNDESRFILIDRCTLPHSVCNWRCRQTLQPSSSVSIQSAPTAPTCWLSDVMCIEHADDGFKLEQSLHLKIERIQKLYESEFHQHNEFYIDIELFFSEKDSQSGASSILDHGPSKQRVILKIPIHNTRNNGPLFYQLQFSGIYRSCLDIFVSQILTESRLVAKNEALLVSDGASVASSFAKGSSTSSQIMSFLMATKRVLQQNTKSIDVQSSSNSSSSSSLDDQKKHKGEDYRVKSVNDAIFHQVCSLFNILRGLDDYPAVQPNSNVSILSTYQLLKDIHLPWNELIQQSSRIEIVSDLLPLQPQFLKGLHDYLGKTDIDLEHANKILLSLSKVCRYGAQELASVSKTVAFESVFVYRRKEWMDMFANMEQYCLNTTEEDFVNNPFQPDNTRVDIQQDISIKQHSPSLSKPAWLIKIKSPLNKHKLLTADSCNYDGLPGLHLIVFVHGLLGHANDLRQIRANIAQYLYNDKSCAADYIYLFSKSNQSNTFDHLITMGNNLAKEVVVYMAQVGYEKIAHISFVSHSLGGLITRVAIRHDLLQPFKSLFHTLVTLGTPHTSQALNKHVVMSSALSLYQTIYNADCIKQLYLLDHTDKRECLLYRLSQDPNLKAFKRVHVVGSAQDLYVHFEGAMLSPLCRYKDYSSDLDTQLQPIYREMQQNIVSNCRDLSRYQVHFEEIDQAKQEWGLAADPLGRTAHIALVTNENAIHLVLANTFLLHGTTTVK